MKTKLLLLIVLLGMAQFAISQTNFITTWQTTVANEGIGIPTNGGGYNYDVDWENDGVFDNLGLTGDAFHIYPTPGIHTVAIRGSFPQIYFANTGYKDYIKSVEQWGSIVWSSMEYAFAGCSIVFNATDTPNLSNVTSMIGMFYYSTFNSDIGDWDVSHVTNMAAMFRQAPTFNQDISSWDVGNITDMRFMFDGASSFNQDIGNWDVSNTTDMTAMFDSASSFNQNISNWDVSNVTNMLGLFVGSSFNQDIGVWDVSNVTNMSQMFGASPFNKNISGWDVGNVTDMSYMFFDNGSFNQNISVWNVSSVTNMSFMFYGATSFNQEIGIWDVSNVTNMSYMFNRSSFNQNIGNWDIGNVTDMSYMFYSAALSTSNYDALLTGWNNLPTLQSGVAFDGGNSTYCNSVTARANLVNSHGWTITDAGFDCSLSITDLDNNSLMIYPNPSTGIFYLKNALGNSVSVFNTLGQEVSKANLNDAKDTQELDLRQLQSGVYILKLSNAVGSISKRLILE